MAASKLTKAQKALEKAKNAERIGDLKAKIASLKGKLSGFTGVKLAEAKLQIVQWEDEVRKLRPARRAKKDKGWW